MGRSQFEKQLMKMIPKTENTSEHKYDQRCGQSNQSDTINDMARAMQSKQYNQRYGQSNAIKAIWRDTIKTNPGVVMVISPITPTQRSSIRAPTLGV